MQRCHWYVNAVGVRFQLPPATSSFAPTDGVPVIAGGAVATSFAPDPATRPTRAPYAVAVPLVSVACTARPSVWPTSRLPCVYVAFVAPWIDLQCAPAESQRYHW